MRTRTARATGARLSFWRAVAGFRLVALLLCSYLVIRWHDIYAHPTWAFATVAAMVVVTAALIPIAWTGRANTVPIVAADLAVTVLFTLASIPAQTVRQEHGHMPTLTTVWAAGPVIEAGILLGAWAGLGAGVVQFLASLVVRDGYDGRTLINGLLLVLAGGFVGYAATLAARTERALEAATAAKAAGAERERMARSIHDGVLQVLSLVHRNGQAAGGAWADIAAAAAQQEIALRGLIAEPDVPTGTRDVCAALRRLRSDQVTVATPAGTIDLDAVAGEELLAAVKAALDNVRVHAGPDAQAWVLLEHDDAQVRITVRDNGAGFAENRLAEAAGERRLGVTQSIRGRVLRLGGQVHITSSVGEGTTVQLAVPAP